MLIFNSYTFGWFIRFFPLTLFTQQLFKISWLKRFRYIPVDTKLKVNIRKTSVEMTFWTSYECFVYAQFRLCVHWDFFRYLKEINCSGN